MKFKFILFILLIIKLSKIKSQEPLRMEQYIMRIVKELSWLVSDDDKIYKINKKKGIVQGIVSNSTQFFCDTTKGRSVILPTSIHKLRPGDIDIIAAIGESVSAGNNGISNRAIVDMVREHRGLSFTGGGLGTWKNLLTLPNILKKFNPNLYGYTIDNSFSIRRNSKFNIGEPALMSTDIPYSAKILVQRLRADPIVDMKQHWKLLTIFIGNLDFCMDICYRSSLEEWITLHEMNLVKAFRFLKQNVPRLFINLASLPNILTLLSLNFKSIPCFVVHRIGCPCLFKPNLDENELEYLRKGLRMWHEKELEIASRQEFNTNEFTVVVQPLFTNFSSGGDLTLRFFAKDCLHFSQLGHACSAYTLWNNMLQPNVFKTNNVGGKLDEILCPSEKYPYLATQNNIDVTTWKKNISKLSSEILSQVFFTLNL